MATSSTQSVHFRNDVLHVDDVPIPQIVAAVGSPVYVYSKTHFERQYAELEAALAAVAVQVCYAVKANSNLAVLNCFKNLGAGFDIVSGGELERVLATGAAPDRVVFSGVGKSTEEIDLALKLGIHCFNVESAGELERIATRATLLGKVAAIAVRVNPDVDANTHPYISTGLKENKFGVPPDQALALFESAHASSALEPIGIACHIGSQISSPGPMLEALDSLLLLVDELARRNISLTHIDLGGGFGTTYDNEPPFDFTSYGEGVKAALGERNLQFVVEPGRFLVANGGILVTTVEYVKPRPGPGHSSFAVVDAAMSELLRPALYEAWHGVENVHRNTLADEDTWDIVGPVCESADFLARSRRLRISAGDCLAIYSAGAYGMVQSSNYNTRPRPPEVLVDHGSFQVVRRRETVSDLLRLELPGG